ncbi:hypothetical protein [Lentzea tibetensis]|uniref:hypothetical protein n=1 Tax=Lentzea tibetensis TaxID=2591470 RepID=UPI0016455CAA|nr:hypothetical protein [Lentzea tibetensis]
MRNDRSVEATGVMGTFVVAAVCATAPRWTDTPQEYCTTDHRTVIVGGEPSSVARTNSSVVLLAIRPRMVEPTGLALFDDVLKVRNDLAGSTLVMLTVTVLADVVTSVPDWVDATLAWGHAAELNTLPALVPRYV